MSKYSRKPKEHKSDQKGWISNKLVTGKIGQVQSVDNFNRQ